MHYRTVKHKAIPNSQKDGFLIVFGHWFMVRELLRDSFLFCRDYQSR